MAFDTETRNKLARMVADARTLLRGEFTRQLQEICGIQPDGKITELEKLTHLDDEQRDVANLLRDRVEHLAIGMGKEKNPVKSAIDRMTREQSFTVLNRFAALRMCEERGLIQQCVGNGMASEGFEVYLQIAGTGLGDRCDRYCSYIFCVYDEIAVDLGILFDRFSPFGLLFPREAALIDLVEILNRKDLKHLWAEDETIGWIYQYYNDPGERKKMRKASAAPRNSRELAVRNQFFTPRYVVEFLTDNTLGRIWYEMTRGQTRLVDQCRYLVRRPTEIFLAEGEAAPEAPDQEGLSQEELLKQPVHIPHRPHKDPREIRLLDPACGSMHFGLYAFDLFETIYEEAWNNGSCPALQKAYSSKDEFHKDVPRLIIEHNIHGIDIDPRAVQIAGLSLWLRAQKAGQAQSVKSADRPRVRRSNIVCAESMPGSPEMLEDFIATLDPPLLGELVKTVFDKMKLAGEAGSLLKIEEEIRTAIGEAQKDWKRTNGQLPGFETSSKSAVLRSLTSNFWETVEDRLLGALRAYAEQADVNSYQRRLFADDAARGFAFIDLCRKRYDTVVMNPPFGEPSVLVLQWLERRFSDFNKNLLCAFLIQAYSMRAPMGKIGSIYDRTAIVKNTYEKFRRSFFLTDDRLEAQCDLGWEVLDANVEATSSVLGDARAGKQAMLFDARSLAPDEKGASIRKKIYAIQDQSQSSMALIPGTTFLRFPNAVLGYDFPDVVKHWFATLSNFKELGVQVLAGHTILADRYFRYWWEVPLTDAFLPQASWQRLYNGGEYSRFSSPLCDAVFYGSGGSLIQEHKSTILRNPRLQQTGKLGFGKRGEFIDAHALPKGFVSSVEGQAVVIHGDADVQATLALLNSTLFQAVINLYCGQHKYPGYVHLFPCVDWSNENLRGAGEAAIRALRAKDRLETSNETHPRFLNAESLVLWEAGTGDRFAAVIAEISKNEVELNEHVLDAYKGGNEARGFIEPYRRREPLTGGIAGEDIRCFRMESVVSFLIGSVFGRWDIRYTIGERLPPELSDPFDPLPVCPPGMLQNAEGLPAEPKDVPADYPLRIFWPGILVDDENHSEDIVSRAREAIEIIWQDRAESIEPEACEILGASDLRDYFRKPAKFFQDHLKRYSKSRRKAPIYWPLSTESGIYTIWVYYHRLIDQTLYTCVKDYLKPKIEDVSRDIERLQKDLAEGGTAKMRSDLERFQNFRQELTDMQDELLRVAKLPYKPNLNDGVMITAAPLWRLFRLKSWQKNLKDCWQKLGGGDYDWAHLAYSIWPDRVKEKCKTDRSIAIAHDLEHLCEVEIKKPKKKKIRKKSAELF